MITVFEFIFVVTDMNAAFGTLVSVGQRLSRQRPIACLMHVAGRVHRAKQPFLE